MKESQFESAVTEIVKVLNQTLNALDRHLIWEEGLKSKLADLTGYLGDFELEDVLNEEDIIQKAVDMIANDELGDVNGLLVELIERIEGDDSYEGLFDIIESVKTMLATEDDKFDSVDSIGSTVFEARELLNNFVVPQKIATENVEQAGVEVFTYDEMVFLSQYNAQELYTAVNEDLKTNSEVTLETSLVDYLKRLFKQSESRFICYALGVGDSVEFTSEAVALIEASTVMDLVHDLHKGLVDAFNLADETPLYEYFNHYFKQ